MVLDDGDGSHAGEARRLGIRRHPWGMHSEKLVHLNDVVGTAAMRLTRLSQYHPKGLLMHDAPLRYHGTVARLKDVECQGRMGQQHQRQWEEAVVA
jgi:hypothetical protein